MSIRNKLRAILGFLVLLALARLGLFGVLNAQEQRANQVRDQAAVIITTVFELTIVSLDYRIFQETRPFLMTEKKISELDRQIRLLSGADPALHATLAGLGRGLAGLQGTFTRLAVMHEGRASARANPDGGLPAALDRTDTSIFRLASLISADANDLMAHARRVMELSQQRARALATLNRDLSLGFDLLMVLLILVIVGVLRRDLLHALSALGAGTRALAAGDLAARIQWTSRDELGVLALAFNDMAEQLDQRQRQLEAMQAQLRSANEGLEQRVAQRTVELTAEAERRQQAIAELSRSNEELRQFAYVASHDLQEPLRMVTSYSDLLRRRLGAQVDADGQRYLDTITEGARRMQGLILALLSYSRIASGGGTFTPTPLDGPLDEALENLHLLIAETGAVIERVPLPTLTVDRSQMVQLFQNLIGNAVKFHGPEPPRVRICARPQPAAWCISVQDNGIGIAPEHHERIFVIFQRLHSRAEIAGTGIGLALCRRICERHGGALTVTSRPGAGATFHIQLPIGQEPA